MVSYGGSGDPMTARLGLATQSMQPELINSSNLGLASGVVVYQLIRPVTSSITRLGLLLGAAGAGAGPCRLGVYSEAGVQLTATVDMTTAFTAAGNNGKTIEGLLAGGAFAWSTSMNYYIAAVSVLATQPTIGGQLSNVQLPAVNGHICVANQTGQTDLPASFTPASAGTPGASFYLYAR
jgi:hypothetical protein